MDLRERKLIKNGVFTKYPKFNLGWNPYNEGGTQAAANMAWNPSSLNNMMSFKPNEPASAMDQYSSFTNGNALAKQNADKMKAAAAPKGGGFNMANAGQALIGAINMGQMIDSAGDYDKNTNLLENEADKRTEYGPAGAYSVSTVNEDRERDEMSKKLRARTWTNIGTGAASGAAIGTAIMPGIGTAIGALGGTIVGGIASIFGNAAAKRKMRRAIENAKFRANVGNDVSRADNTSAYLENLGTTKYAFKDGKDVLPHYAEGKVNTSAGLIPGLPMNSYTNKGEWIWDGGYNLSKVNRGAGDTAPSYVTGKDTVFTKSKKYPGPFGFKTIADAVPYAAMTGQLPELAEYLKNMHMMSYRCGKDAIPHYGLGKTWNGIKNWANNNINTDAIPNYITTGMGLLTAYNQLNEAKNELPYRPSILVQNPYDNLTSNIMANRRVNRKAIEDSLLEAQNIALNDITSHGGSAGDKSKRRLAALNITLNNRRKAMLDADNTDNAYLADYANFKYRAGNEIAARAMQDKQYGDSVYQGAMSAKRQGIETGRYNILNNLNKFYENEFKRKQFNETMGLYNQKLDIDKANAIINSINLNPSTALKVASVNSVAPVYSNYMSNKSPLYNQQSFDKLLGSDTSGLMKQYAAFAANPMFSRYAPKYTFPKYR